MFNPVSFRHPETPYRRFSMPEIIGYEQDDIDGDALSNEPDDHDLAPYRAMAGGEW